MWHSAERDVERHNWRAGHAAVDRLRLNALVDEPYVVKLGQLDYAPDASFEVVVDLGEPHSIV